MIGVRGGWGVAQRAIVVASAASAVALRLSHRASWVDCASRDRGVSVMAGLSGMGKVRPGTVPPPKPYRQGSVAINAGVITAPDVIGELARVNDKATVVTSAARDTAERTIRVR